MIQEIFLTGGNFFDIVVSEKEGLRMGEKTYFADDMGFYEYKDRKVEKSPIYYLALVGFAALIIKLLMR